MQYLVTSFSYTGPGCQRYFDTLPLSGCQGIVIEYQGLAPVNYPKEVDVYKIKSGYKGNTGRFLPLYDLFQQKEYDKDDWFIFTDTHDVWFQHEIPNLDQYFAPIIVSAEGKSFGEIDFWKERLPQSMQGWPALNVGTFAMKYEMWLEFLKAVRGSYQAIMDWYKGPHGDLWPKDTELIRKYITATFNAYADTMLFNTFVHNRTYVAAPEVFNCIGFQLELGHMKEKNQKYYTELDELISVVHANGDSKLKLK